MTLAFPLPRASALLLAVWIVTGCERHPPAVPLPPEVYYTAAVSKDVSVYSEWIGNTQGQVTADIRPKVQGYLLKQTYQDGMQVKSGQPLYQIDPSQYQAAVAQAEGELARAQAELERSKVNVSIYEPLVKKGAVSQLEYLDAVQQQKANEAAVAAARASLQQAKLNLGWTRVSAPFDGVAGISQAKVGDLVGTATVLTVISQVDPVKVEFPISEQQYLALAENNSAKGTAAVLAHAPPLLMTLANGAEYAQAGKLIDLGLGVDPTTGTMKMQGLFPNPGGILRPGQFVRVRTMTQQLPGATVVPQRAIVDVQGQWHVALVTGPDTFQLRPVRPGPLDGTDQVILDGVKPGDKVIVDGLTKLRPGEKIAPRPVSAEPKITAPTPAPAAK